MSGQYSPEDTARGDDVDAELRKEVVPVATLQDVVTALNAIHDIQLIQGEALSELCELARQVRARR